MIRRTVPVTMPEKVWGRLASIAETKHTTVADLIAVTLGGLIGDEPGIRAPRNDAWVTGVPGHRLEVLDVELKAARANGWRSPQRNRRTV